jgi:uncharacterized membrane protein YccF (DUF307 family)
MKTLGNIVWFIFGGFEMAVAWFLVGLVWCVTIIGIPVGIQAFKFAKLALWPFGKEVMYGGGAGKAFLNVIWLIFGGLFLALGQFLVGIVCCITIIGIPFGKQHFKLGRLALMPFGATVS